MELTIVLIIFFIITKVFIIIKIIGRMEKKLMKHY